MSKVDYRSKYVTYTDLKKFTDVKFHTDELEIKPSNIKNENGDVMDGVFAKCHIPKGTILCDINDMNVFNFNGAIKSKLSQFGKKMNDLNYDCTTGISTYTYNIEHNDKNNIGFIVNSNSNPYIAQYGLLYALRDIEKGEELSRYYGIYYWYSVEYKMKYPLTLTTHPFDYLPEVFRFVDEYRIKLTYNKNECVFGRKLPNGNYQYVIGIGINSGFYNQIENMNKLQILKEEKSRNDYMIDNTQYLVDVSKKDGSMYKVDEPLEHVSYNYLWSTTYLHDNF